MIFRSRMAILLFCWIFVGKWMVFMGCKVHDARMMQKIKEILANRTGLGWVLFQVSIIQRHQSTRAIEWSACSFWMLCWTWHFQLFSHVFPMVTNWKKSGWGVTGHPLALIHVDPCWEDRPWPWLLPHQLHQAARWDPWASGDTGDTGDGISPSGSGPAVGRGGSRLGRWLEQGHGLISAISDPCNKVTRLW